MDNPCCDLLFRGMEFDTDIAIIGGGLNGPALALALAQTGQRVTLIDTLGLSVRKDAKFEGRSYALALTSVRLLQGLGVWLSLIHI